MRYQTIAVQFRCGFTMIQRRVQCERTSATLRGLPTVPIPSNGAERCQLCRFRRTVPSGVNCADPAERCSADRRTERNPTASQPDRSRTGSEYSEPKLPVTMVLPRARATRPMYTFVYPEPSKSPFAHDFRIFYPIIQPVGTFSFRRCEPAVPFRPSALRCIS